MEIEAIFENGVIRPRTPLHLKQKRVKVQVIIPDVHIDHRPTKQSSLRKEINSILGKYGHSRQISTPKQDKTIWQEHLVEKYDK